jgi:hypothetical protein
MPRTRPRPLPNTAMVGSTGDSRDRRLSSPGKLWARVRGRGRNRRVTPHAASTSRASLQADAAPAWFPCAAGWFPAWLLQAEPYVDRPGSDARVPLAQRCELMELDLHTCRWPVGDPADSGFFFCGGRVAAGRPYCPKHCARAYLRPGISAARNN